MEYLFAPNLPFQLSRKSRGEKKKKRGNNRFILIAKRIDLLKGFGADGCLVLSYGFTIASLCSLTISTF